MLPKKDVVLLKDLLKDEKNDEIKSILQNLHPVDIVQILKEIKSDDKKNLLKLMGAAKAADVLEEFDDPAESILLLEQMNEQEKIRILEEMSVDEITDLLQEMSTKQVEELVSKLPKDAYELKILLQQEEDTAGGLMTTDYVYIFSNSTVNEAIDDVRRFGREAETIYYLYVVDEEKHLLGVLSLRELISAPRQSNIKDVMRKSVVSVELDCDQEEVAKTMSKYSLLAIPVVNKEKKLLGIVTVDDALEVMEEESSEDFHMMAGISPEEEIALTSSVFGAFKKRIFWLIICLFGDLISSLVLDGYQNILETVVQVAFFIPVLMATGGNMGTQSLALSVRGIATGEVSKKNVLSFIKDETLAGLQVGIICGILLAFIALLWQKNINLGVVLGLSMGIALMLSAFIGVLVPVIFNLLKIDPAVASGPFITTIVDACTLLIYFTFVSYFLRQSLAGISAFRASTIGEWLLC